MQDFSKTFALPRPDATIPARLPEESQKIVTVDRPSPRAEPTSAEQTVSEPVPRPKATYAENTPIPEATPEPTVAYHFSAGPGNPEAVFPHSSPTPAAISVQALPNISPGENTPNQGVKTRRATAVSPTPTQVHRAEPVQPETSAVRVLELKAQIRQLKEERKNLLENERLLESTE
jgi:hypothetical protein